ncbi:hypothetical protein [Pantoea agglomerans]|uniref:hypothetical protein n=1 Tax=Enterobacter agglomerans TaxID=549 RepID=UPI003C7E5546
MKIFNIKPKVNIKSVFNKLTATFGFAALFNIFPYILINLLAALELFFKATGAIKNYTADIPLFYLDVDSLNFFLFLLFMALSMSCFLIERRINIYKQTKGDLL